MKKPSAEKIPYTLPKFSKAEIESVNDLLLNPSNFVDEKYTKACKKLLTELYQAETLLTHSCTGALEISALLLNITPGDEVILPSFTFVSTANAFTLLGAKPVFIDSEASTFNIDPSLIEQAITPRTKAIIVMHYAAISCDMPRILEIANTYNLPVIEDAAQCLGATFQSVPLGTLGKLGALSFHHTKNVTSGLGGALLFNGSELLARAKICWQKGTDREAFIEGQVDKYTWQDLGSSYTMNELGAALLHGQLARLPKITDSRLASWNRYHEAFLTLEQRYGFRRPIIPNGCCHNGHIYYLLAPTQENALKLRHSLASAQIEATSHYVPLHLAPAALKYSDRQSLPVCENFFNRIVRLPLWDGIDVHLDKIIEQTYQSV